MNEYVIKLYETLNTKVCPDELISGDFNEQPIPYDYYNFLNDDDGYGNNIPGNTVDDLPPNNKGVQDVIVTNYEYIDDDIITDYDDSLTSYIDHLQNKIL